MNPASWLLTFLSYSIWAVAAHVQTHLKVCFPDLGLIKLTVKGNYCTSMDEVAQFPEADFQPCTGESLDWGSNSETKEQPFFPRQEG